MIEDRILVVETPVLHLDGRSNGPGFTNRLVAPCPLTDPLYVCSLELFFFFRKIRLFPKSQEKGSLEKVVANGSIK